AVLRLVVEPDGAYQEGPGPPPRSVAVGGLQVQVVLPGLRVPGGEAVPVVAVVVDEEGREIDQDRHRDGEEEPEEEPYDEARLAAAADDGQQAHPRGQRPEAEADPFDGEDKAGEEPGEEEGEDPPAFFVKEAEGEADRQEPEEEEENIEQAGSGEDD